MNPKVDAFIGREKKWQAEFMKLREILLTSPLEEDLKWGVPCYTLNGKNVVLMHGFKEYCALLFVKGALIKDEAGVLIQQTENVQAARQVRFTHLDEIEELEPVLKALVAQAIEIERAGLKVELKPTAAFSMVEEFGALLEKDPKVKPAFEALTPGRQRAYLLFFAAPKTAQTRLARIEKSVPNILMGKGLND